MPAAACRRRFRRGAPAATLLACCCAVRVTSAPAEAMRRDRERAPRADICLPRRHAPPTLSMLPIFFSRRRYFARVIFHFPSDAPLAAIFTPKPGWLASRHARQLTPPISLFFTLTVFCFPISQKVFFTLLAFTLRFLQMPLALFSMNIVFADTPPFAMPLLPLPPPIITLSPRHIFTSAFRHTRAITFRYFAAAISIRHAMPPADYISQRLSFRH